MAPKISELQPIDPASIPDSEKETGAPWITRKLVGSMAGRIVTSSYESLRAGGTSVICLSPWGDSSPFLFPCIRFREVAAHVAAAATTGGGAILAAPIMSAIADVLISDPVGSVVVERGPHVGFNRGNKAANELLLESPISHALPTNDRRLSTTVIKSLTITLKHKNTMTDAALRFFRSTIHADPSLFSNVKDYFSIEKGWFSPYLFASGRRPIIPRNMTPDIIFCHGPFVGGDYRVGKILLKESATVLALCDMPTPQPPRPASNSTTMPDRFLPTSREARIDSSTSTTTNLSASPGIPPRRMVVMVLGIKPYRRFWANSARPGESVIEYILLNGCPAIVLPILQGGPLIAWDTLTLEHLHKVSNEPGGVDGAKARGIADVINEYLCLCIDWERTIVPGVVMKESTEYDTEQSETDMETKKRVVRDSVRLLVAGAIRSGESKEVKKKVDLDRAGIVIFRIP